MVGTNRTVRFRGGPTRHLDLLGPRKKERRQAPQGDTTSLFQIHQILPEQVDAGREGPPETRLWVAVLALAISEAISEPRSHRGRREKEDAIRWIEDDSRQVGSFIWTCESLGLQPERLRDALSGLGCGRSST